MTRDQLRILVDLIDCAAAWEDGVRLLGNLTALEIRTTVIAVLEELDNPSRPQCRDCGSPLSDICRDCERLWQL